MNNRQKIRFSGFGAARQNGAVECTINMLVSMVSTMLMHTARICTKDTFSTDFGQRKWNMVYGSTVGYLILSMVYKILGKFYPYTSWSHCCRSLYLKPLNGIQEVKERFIWAVESFNQHKLGFF